MRPNTIPLFVLSLCVTGLLLALSAPAGAQVHCSQCSCESSCSTVCYYLQRVCEPITPDGGGCTFETVDTTCGAWGTCTTATNCAACPNLSCGSTIHLTSGNDTFNGTAALECIYGLDGNDTLDGKAGDDRIYGDNGSDTLYGDTGNDCLWGGPGTDDCDGGIGSDTLMTCNP